MSFTPNTGFAGDPGNSTIPRRQPAYSIQRDPSNDNAPVIYPKYGSQELVDALSLEFPEIPSSKGRYQAAVQQFLDEEKASNTLVPNQRLEPRHSPPELNGASSTQTDAPIAGQQSTRRSSTTSKKSTQKAKGKPRGKRTGRLSQETSESARLSRKYKAACEEHRGKKVTVKSICLPFATLTHV